MGAPQFMPSSYRRYGVDADADRHVDLWANWRDVFASVANLLRANGWQPGAPVLAEAQLAPGAAVPVAPRMLELTQTVEGLRALGISTQTSVPGNTPAVLISAEQPDRARVSRRLQQFLRDQPLQPQRALRDGRERSRRRAGRGDGRGGRSGGACAALAPPP